MDQVVVRGMGYRRLVSAIAGECAYQARCGWRLTHSVQGPMRWFMGGGMGTPMSRVLHFEPARTMTLTEPVGKIVVQVVRYSVGSWGANRVHRRIEDARAMGGREWFVLNVSDRGYPYTVIGLELPSPPSPIDAWIRRPSRAAW